MEILSKTKLKEISKLKLKKYRDLENRFIIEGEHLINEATKAGINLNVYDISDLSKSEIKTISDLECPSNIIAVANKNETNELIGNKYLLLDEIQDPGNLGTIIRSALAFNIDTIVIGDNSCDLYNEKVIRGTQGSMFHINIIHMNLEECISILKQRNITVLGTNVENGTDINELEKLNAYAIVMGNEGRGLNQNIQDLCDKNIYIKTNNLSESLNVAMATTIILYELDKR